MKKIILTALLCLLAMSIEARKVMVDVVSQATPTQDWKKEGALPRKKPSKVMKAAFQAYLTAAKESGTDLHSVMILQHGKVVEERWMSEGAPDKPHALHSVSKTFTATAVGLCINEGYLKLDDKVISFFPDKVPANPSENLQKMTVRDLLTMNCGHETEPRSARNTPGVDWVTEFLAHPVPHVPGTWYCYNSMGTYMLSAIVQKVTGSTLLEYLTPRLFEPLAIEGVQWDESPQGINCGGWGLYLKTEDLAKMGQLLLQKGKWKGKQLLPEKWVEEASRKQVISAPAGQKQIEEEDPTSDWRQGYGYQMWRCRHNCFRADGAYGQYIIVMPDQDAVVVNTAHVGDMQKEINLIWDYLLPVLDKK